MCLKDTDERIFLYSESKLIEYGNSLVIVTISSSQCHAKDIELKARNSGILTMKEVDHQGTINRPFVKRNPRNRRPPIRVSTIGNNRCDHEVCTASRE